VVGTDSFEVEGGQVSRDSAGALSGAGCRVAVDGDVVVSVKVDFMLGYAGSGFRDGLKDERYNQLPEDAGLGYSWIAKSGEDGPTTAEARRSRGDNITETEDVGNVDWHDHDDGWVAVRGQVMGQN